MYARCSCPFSWAYSGRQGYHTGGILHPRAVSAVKNVVQEPLRLKRMDGGRGSCGGGRSGVRVCASWAKKRLVFEESTWCLLRNARLACIPRWWVRLSNAHRAIAAWIRWDSLLQRLYDDVVETDRDWKGPSQIGAVELACSAPEHTRMCLDVGVVGVTMWAQGAYRDDFKVHRKCSHPNDGTVE